MAVSALKSETFDKRLPNVSYLKPLRRNFDRIEAERIYRVINSAERKIEELQMLLSAIEDDKKIFSIGDEELRNLILNHQNIVQRYKLRGSGRVDAIAALKNSLRDILRYIDTHGTSLTLYNKENVTPSSTSVLYHYLQQLCAVTVEKLLTPLGEENRLNALQLRTMEKNRQCATDISSLIKVLAKKSKIKVLELTALDRVVFQYERDINIRNMAAKDLTDKICNTAAKSILTEHQQHQQHQLRMHQDTIDLKKNIMLREIPNVSEEFSMRKRKMKMFVELVNWMEKYDGDMGWRQEELEKLQQSHQIDLENLKQMDEHFIEMEKAYLDVTEERRLKKEERIRVKKEEKRRDLACKKIQAMWRGYLQRVGFVSKKNKKKDKKKKGGKKKKK